MKALILSATQVKLWESCERQYFYERILKVPTNRSTASMQLGIDIENSIEAWLKDGVPCPPDKSGRMASALLYHLPERGTPGLEFQTSFNRPVEGLEGVSFTGRLDLRIRSKEGLSTIVDYKSTSSIERWALTERTLPSDLQAQLYAYNEIIDTELPSQAMRWTYVQTKGPMATLPVDVRINREQAQGGYERVKRAALRILEIRQDGYKLEDTKFNKSACGNFGGCVHRSYCPATQHQSISQLFQENDMGLLDRLNAAKIATATATATATTATATAAPTPEPVAEVVQPEVNPPDAAPSPDSIPEKKTRAKKEKAPPAPVLPVEAAIVVASEEVARVSVEAVAQPVQQGFTLLVNATSKDAVSLAPLVQAAARLAAERGNVLDYRLVEYGRGAPLLLLAFVELFKPARAFYSIDLRQPESAIVLGYLESKADGVIRGF